MDTGELSRVTCHMSHVTCHMSHVTCHMSSPSLQFKWMKVDYEGGEGGGIDLTHVLGQLQAQVGCGGGAA